MDLLDLILAILTRWLMPPAPWLVHRVARAFWLDGAGKGILVGVPLGGVIAYACLVLARLLLWLVRKRDRR